MEGSFFPGNYSGAEPAGVQICQGKQEMKSWTE
jgi:hypothetical protein